MSAIGKNLSRRGALRASLAALLAGAALPLAGCGGAPTDAGADAGSNADSSGAGA